MPAEVEMVVRIPKELGDHDHIVARLVERIAEVEDQCAKDSRR